MILEWNPLFTGFWKESGMDATFLLSIWITIYLKNKSYVHFLSYIWVTSMFFVKEEFSSEKHDV